MNDVFKYVYNRFVRNQEKWFPFISVYYLTYSCDFRCSYCSDGNGKPYYSLHSPNVSAEQALSTVRKIRENTKVMTLTGGEPLLHPEFGKIITEIGKMKFKNLLLTTNGYYVDQYLSEIAEAVDTLIFSLDSLDSKKSDNLYGMPGGTFDKILENIDIAYRFKPRKYDILISSVVTNDNIRDLYEVYNFSKEKGFGFAACPQLVGVNPHALLWKNKEYSAFFDFLIKEKKKNPKIYGSTKYLEYLRDLKNFNCTPFAMLVVSPDDSVYYPCLEIGNLVGNINDYTKIHEMKKIGLHTFGEAPKCGNQCHSACALTFSLLLGEG